MTTNMEKGDHSDHSEKLTTETTAHDWQTGKSLTQCLHHVFTQEIGTDVAFIVGEERIRISAHKFILTNRSAVFFAMFNGLLKEEGDVEIPDIMEDTFRLFLCFLYTDKIDLTIDNVTPVMSVARKYCVDVLLDRCKTFVKEKVSSANACFLLEKAHFYVLDQMIEICLKCIYTSLKTTMNSDSFVDLCPQCLTRITESDELAVDEGTVYHAVMKWANQECVRQNMENTSKNKKTVLGNILDTVRFPIMEQDFVLDNVCMDEILTNDDSVNLLMYIRKNKQDLDTTFCKRRRRTPPTPTPVAPSVLPNSSLNVAGQRNPRKPICIGLRSVPGN